ncbi:probable mediator of RNA polymerase II transcription subunit 26c [Dioscorea cayenensis subsp. rotundata]|uniref:Probable mediator of RNA polymerase II transcription subunit 26c n=1 Tax=Dioscorea cayennensis subsp. rotundata TaxID=55577 RepID=A0AB40CH12_DIOCR|nr:probable mediator of RNA polymerase II transcription subunit 26c [Dioscorea cayenensis subsp. rotundata]
MDPDNVGEVLRTYNVDLWSLIDAAISMAARDLPGELRSRRDSIVKRLYSPEPSRCRSCAAAGEDLGHRSSDAKEISSLGDSDADEGDLHLHRDQDQNHRINPDCPIDSEKRRILAVKELLEDPDQNEEVLVNRLQKLIDMDITFKALKETDIGRHVNGLRKHPSGEVRRLVKLLVRKWKDLVDDWVKSNSDAADSPQQTAGKMNQNEHQLVVFDYSPNPHNGGLVLESESRGKNIPRRDAPPKLSPPATVKAVNDEKDGLIDPERLASARKRLHENYQEAQNAKKQRTIQVMDIHEIPKPKNSFLPRNKGGPHGKRW